MNYYVSGHNWSVKVNIDSSVDKSDRYSEAAQEH